MARRTKEDAQATRNRILDAAERVFEQRGVSRATLDEIAAAAGVSRGAIYWHFDDKAEIFDAMMRRVLLPLEEAGRRDGDGTPGVDGLAGLRAGLVHALRQIVDNDRLRRVFEIALHKVEYVDELAKVRLRRIDTCRDHTRKLRDTLQRAIDDGKLSARMSADAAATGLHAMIDGVVQTWMLDPQAFDLVDLGEQIFDTFLAGLAVPARKSL